MFHLRTELHQADHWPTKDAAEEAVTRYGRQDVDDFDYKVTRHRDGYIALIFDGGRCVGYLVESN